MEVNPDSSTLGPASQKVSPKIYSNDLLLTKMSPTHQKPGVINPGLTLTVQAPEANT